MRRTFTDVRPGRLAVHSYGVLAFHVGGRLRVEHRGELDVDAGHVHVLPAGDPHRILAARGVDMWGLGVCRTCLSDQHAGLLSVFDRVRAGALPLLELPTGRQAHVIALLQELQREQTAPDAHRALITESLLTLILAEVARASRVTPAPSPDETSLVPAALALIEARCLGPLTLDEVARTLRRSPAHVTTAVRRATGRTVGEWIREGRLAEARRRLVDTDECVDIIAERVGYSDASAFGRSFRKHQGVAPGVFRRQERARSEGGARSDIS